MLSPSVCQRNVEGGVLRSQIKNWSFVKGRFDGRRSTMRTQRMNGYHVDIDLERNEDGVLVCSSIHINYPKDKGIPNQSINSSYLQKLGIGELLMMAREAYVEREGLMNEIDEEKIVDELLCDWTQLGPSGFPAEKYAAIAWKYEKFVMLGHKHPVSALGEYMKCDKSTASGRVLEARKRGLLTKPKKGNFGGKLTTQGKKLLGIGANGAKKSQ